MTDWTFWLAVVGATIVRVLASPYHSILRSAVMVATSLLFALVFVDPVVAWLALDPATYKTAVAVLIALTADGLMRVIIMVSTDPKSALDLWRRFRGGKE